MKEELEQVEKDIQDVLARLKILKQRRMDLKMKLEAPMHLIGKYIKQSYDGTYTCCMKVDEISGSRIPGEFTAEGPGVEVRLTSLEIDYNISTVQSIDLQDEYVEITEQEYNKILDEAISKFKSAEGNSEN